MSLRILLADDEKEFVDTLAERLSLRGFAPYVVYDGISALQAATPEKPDVVVLDLFMRPKRLRWKPLAKGSARGNSFIAGQHKAPAGGQPAAGALC